MASSVSGPGFRSDPGAASSNPLDIPQKSENGTSSSARVSRPQKPTQTRDPNSKRSVHSRVGPALDDVASLSPEKATKAITRAPHPGVDHLRRFKGSKNDDVSQLHLDISALMTPRGAAAKPAEIPLLTSRSRIDLLRRTATMTGDLRGILIHKAISRNPDLVKGNNLLAPVWMTEVSSNQNGEMQKLQIPLKAFQGILASFHDVPEGTKIELLEAVIIWAKDENSPKIRENQEMIQLANEILVAASSSSSVRVKEKVKELRDVLSKDYSAFEVGPSTSRTNPENIVHLSDVNKQVASGILKDKDYRKLVIQVTHSLHSQNVKLYKSADLSDFYNMKLPSSSLAAITRHAQSVNFSIISSILTNLTTCKKGQHSKEALRMLNFYLDVAKEAYNAGDLNTAKTIANSLSSQSIGSLIRAIPDSKEKIAFNEALEAFKQNVSDGSGGKAILDAQNKALKESSNEQLPPIPYLYQITRDLETASLGNQDFGDNPKAVNTTKVEIMGNNFTRITPFLDKIKSYKGPLSNSALQTEVKAPLPRDFPEDDKEMTQFNNVQDSITEGFWELKEKILKAAGWKK